MITRTFWLTSAIVFLLCTQVPAAPNPCQWGAKGVVVRQDMGLETSGINVPADSGGMFVVWQDRRTGNPDIYVQFVNSEGRALWADSGMPVVQSPGEQKALSAIAVAGGWIVLWSEQRLRKDLPPEEYYEDSAPPKHPMWPDGALRAQKLDTRGRPLWKSKGMIGVELSPGLWHREPSPQLVDDGQGGAFAVWVENHADSMRVAAIRVSAQGKILWPQPVNVTGNLVAGSASLAAVASDSGSVLIVWSMSDHGNVLAFRVSRITADGSLPWGQDGKELLWPTTTNQFDLLATSDGAGGCMIAAQASLPPKRDTLQIQKKMPPDAQSRSRKKVRAPFPGSRSSLWLQRIDAAGSPVWRTAWAAVAPEIGSQATAIAASRNASGVDGCLLLWNEATAFNRAGRIAVQKIGLDGRFLWDSLGISIAACADTVYRAKVLIESNRLTSDREGGALVCWQKKTRNEDVLFADVRLSRINSNGHFVWGAEGVLVSDANTEDFKISLAPSKSSYLGVFSDSDNGTKSTRIVRLNPEDGALMPSSKGNFFLATEDGSADDPHAVAMSKDRVAVVWRMQNGGQDLGLGNNVLNSNGRLSYPSSGQALMVFDRPSQASSARPQICSDGIGGLFAALPQNLPERKELMVRRVTAEGEPYGESAEGTAVNYFCTPVGGYSAVNLVPAGPGHCCASVFDASHDREYPNLVRITRLDETQRTCQGWGEAIAVNQRGEMQFNGMTSAGDSSVLEVWQEKERYDTTLHEFLWSLRAAWITSHNAGLWFKTICDGWSVYKPFMVSDNHTGGYAVWQAGRNQMQEHEIRAQHLDSTGVFLWGDNGILVGDAVPDHPPTELANIASDSAGFLYLLLNKENQYRLQKMTMTGETLWPRDGIALAPPDTNRQSAPKSAPFPRKKLAARKSGAPERLAPPAKSARFQSHDQTGEERLVADEAGGCFAVWTQRGTNGTKQLVAAHVDREGRSLLHSGKQNPLMLTDGNVAGMGSVVRTTTGDFVVVWTEIPEGLNPQGALIKAQRIKNLALRHPGK